MSEAEKKLAEAASELEIHTDRAGGLMALLRGYLYYLAHGGNPIDTLEAEQVSALLLRHQLDGQRVNEDVSNAYKAQSSAGQ